MQGVQNGSRHRGIGRYIGAFVRHLVGLGSGHEILLAFNGAIEQSLSEVLAEYRELVGAENVYVWQSLAHVHHADPRNDARRKTSEYLREAFFAGLRADVVLVSSFVEGAGDDVVTSIGTYPFAPPTAVILYDLIPLVYQREYLADHWIDRWYHEKLEYISRAQLLLAISESTAAEGEKYLAVSRDAIATISAAVEPSFFQIQPAPIDEIRARLGIARDYVMYCGASDPRKNLDRLIRAFAQLSPSLLGRNQLVLAGGMPVDHRDALTRLADSLHIKRSVVFTGHISDETMVALYANATVFVFPSMHEGFGLPLLEAMGFGVPVIGGNLSSIPEVIGFDDALFDPFSESSIANALTRALSEPAFRETLRKHGARQMQKFAWTNTARSAVAALERRFGSWHRDSVSFHAATVDRSNVSMERDLAALLTASKADIPASDLESIAHAILQIRRLPYRNPRILVDVSEFHRRDSASGIQRVVRNVARQLIRHPPTGYDLQFVYANEDTDYREANAFTVKHFGDIRSSAFRPDVAVDFRPGDIFLGLDYHDQIIVRRRKTFARLRDIDVRVYFVLYDLIPQTHSSYFIDEVRSNHRLWLETVIQSDGIICISKTVADQLVDWLSQHRPPRAQPLHIGWFHLGADSFAHNASKTTDTVRVQPQAGVASAAAFLVVSTIEPRKQQSFVLDAFELLWKDDPQLRLTFVGKIGWMMEAFEKRLLSHPRFGKQLFWLANASDEQLAAEYQSASCIIAASVTEGFGLSLVEAAVHGKPVIARDIKVFREVGSSRATYFSDESPASLAAAVTGWLQRKRDGDATADDVVPFISWRESATQLVKAVVEEKWYSTLLP